MDRRRKVEEQKEERKKAGKASKIKKFFGLIRKKKKTPVTNETDSNLGDEKDIVVTTLDGNISDLGLFSNGLPLTQPPPGVANPKPSVSLNTTGQRSTEKSSPELRNIQNEGIVKKDIIQSIFQNPSKKFKVDEMLSLDALYFGGRRDIAIIDLNPQLPVENADSDSS